MIATMRIGLTYDLRTNPEELRQAEFDPPRTIEMLETALGRLGHTVVRLGNAQALLASRRKLRKVELVLNLAEGSIGRTREAWVPALLERWGVPFIGSGCTALTLALDKVMSKRLAVSSELRTAPWLAVDEPEGLPRDIPLAFPVIVKPRFGGSGMGIDAGAVVGDGDALKRRVAWLYGQLREPLLIEEFVAFGELTVFLIGNDPLACLPVVQRPLDPQTRLSCHVIREATAEALAPVALTPEIEEIASNMALTMFRALGCRDMARVDIRMDHVGRLSFLEINPLPSFDPDGTLGLIAECLGVSFEALVGRIVDAALERLHQPAPALA